MEGLTLAFAGFVVGFQCSYWYWNKKIHSQESLRVMTRILALESALRWEKARGDAFLEDIKRRYESKE